MVAELKNYQSQVQAYRFEIERIDKQITQAKDTYFSILKSNNHHLGVVAEDPEYTN